MRHLHPVAWLGIGASLGFLVLATSNWTIGLMALACAVLLSSARRGPRVGAFVRSAAVGGMAFVAHLTLGALVGGVPPDPTVIAFLPEWTLGQGVSVGGPYSLEQLAVSVERGVDAWVLCGLVGLMWQACTGGQWCDLARSVLGRGSHLLAPGLFLGESLAVGGPRLRGRSASLLEADRELCDAWRSHSRPSRPDPLHALVAAVLLLVVTGLLYRVATMGGLRVQLSGGRVTVVTARVLLLGIGVAWCAARLVVTRPRLVPRLRWVDAVALLGCAAVGAGIAVARRTGDGAALAPDPDGWPGLPLALTAGLAVALVLWVASETASARGGS